MKWSIHALSACLLILSSQLYGDDLKFADSAESPDICCCSFNHSPYFPYKFYIDHVEGRGIGYKSGYTSLGLFASHSDSTYDMGSLRVFLDARAHIFNNERFAGNLGIGMRKINYNQCVVYGINLYYDCRDTDKSFFNQLAPGFEALWERWELRTNFYFPVGDSIQGPKRKVFDYPGGFRAVCKSREAALSGGNLEVGYYPQRRPCECYDVYLGIGPYYFQRKCGKNILGGNLRGRVDMSRNFSAEATLSFDEAFGLTAQARLTFTFGLGGSQSIRKPCNISCDQVCLLQEMALAPAYRQEIIATQHFCSWKTNFDSPSTCSACSN